ncbi:MAG: sigma-54-dependent Fis family transcriptional regulator [Rickettsia sp.]|nr:sigma-54-dependent Fis family transcriptional regulator [Rickettsia sp.]
MLLNVLILDDELSECNSLSSLLNKSSFSFNISHDSDGLFSALAMKYPNVIMLDTWLKGSIIDSLGIVEILCKEYPSIPIVMITEKNRIDIALEAIKLGAVEYFEKPICKEKLNLLLHRVCKISSLTKENQELKSKVIDQEEFIGNATSVMRVKNQINRIANSSSRIFIQGDIGTGKKLVASLLHKKSSRSHANFVNFSPYNLSNSEILYSLFGEVSSSHLKNTSDVTLFKGHKSLLEICDKGSIHIEDIESLDFDMQDRLLAFISDGFIYKNNKKIHLDVRIISSSSDNLEKKVQEDKFSSDLFYRLNVVNVKLPELKNRKEDIKLLANYFMDRLFHTAGLQPKIFSDDSLIALQSYQWPGNIRQLRNVVEWVLIMSPCVSKNPTNNIEIEMLPREILKSASIVEGKEIDNMMYMPLRKARELFEKKYLLAQMYRFNNNISKASNFIGMERSALHRKLKNLSIHGMNRSSSELKVQISVT